MGVYRCSAEFRSLLCVHECIYCMYSIVHVYIVFWILCAVVKSVPTNSKSCEKIQHRFYSSSTMSGKDQHLRDVLLEKTSEVQRCKAEIEK